MIDPARVMMTSTGWGWAGCWLTSEDRMMYVTNYEDFEPIDFLSEGEDEDALIRNGRLPAGAAYVDYLTGNGVIEGGCFLFWEDQDLVEWCEGNGFPRPVASLPEEAWDAARDYHYYHE